MDRDACNRAGGCQRGAELGGCGSSPCAAATDGGVAGGGGGELTSLIASRTWSMTSLPASIVPSSALSASSAVAAASAFACLVSSDEPRRISVDGGLVGLVLSVGLVGRIRHWESPSGR